MVEAPREDSDIAAFSRRISDLEPVKADAALEELNRYGLTAREAKLAECVCSEDAVVALASPKMMRLLCLALIESRENSLVVILKENISHDAELLHYLSLFFPDNVSVVSDMPPLGPGIRLMEPDVMWICLQTGVLSKHMVGALVFLDFQHYREPAHIYRAIMGLFQDALGRKQPESTRMLAFAEDLRARGVDDLEVTLASLRTPLRLTCLLGTPSRPHSKTIALQVLSVNADWMSFAGEVLSSSDDLHAQLVAITLLERGIVAARDQAREIVRIRLIPELELFLLNTERLLARIKGKIVLDHLQGRTLALTSTLDLQRKIKRWLREVGAPVIDRPDEREHTRRAVLVATMGRIPTLQRFCWDSVVFCDLPFGIACDRLLMNSTCAVALATAPERQKWEDVLALHDDLENLLRRVNV
ncbi:hypothetical protein HPB48_001233 [Haemaphysalis longicornis]|uniref:Uncharacterized protein n=1 Tax=Haemaphysalis longicornis TaxID=44386 RepID=A0A9J6F8W8_HAELO|nr:hypothetical protein HPB48_001233 [Haemaphysalis longicornis]